MSVSAFSSSFLSSTFPVLGCVWGASFFAICASAGAAARKEDVGRSAHPHSLDTTLVRKEEASCQANGSFSLSPLVRIQGEKPTGEVEKELAAWW